MTNDARLAALSALHPAARRVLASPRFDYARRSGSGLLLYDALLGARRVAGPEEREAIDRMFAARHLFADPLRRPVRLRTSRWVGLALRGSTRSPAEEGSRAGTLVWRFLGVPLWPLRGVVVVDEGGRALETGRFPLSIGEQRWRLALPPSVFLAAALVALVFWLTSTVHLVHFVNGLDVPVTIAWDDRTVRLKPGAVARQNVPSGRCHFVARAESGEILEELDVRVPYGADFTVYNVLGAAAVHVSNRVYVAESLAPADAAKVRESTDTNWAGTSWIDTGHVDWPFSDIPSRTLVRKDHEVIRTATLEGDWRFAGTELLKNGDREAAVRLALRVVLAQRDEHAIDIAMQVAAGEESERMLRLAEAVVERVPGSRSAHVVLGDSLVRLERSAEAVERYRTAFATDPESASAAFLYARLLPPSQAMPVLDAAVERHPDDPWLLREAGFARFQRAEFKEALRNFERLGALPVRAVGVRARHAFALAALGDVPAAQVAARAGIGTGGWDCAVIFAMLSRLPSADPSQLDAFAAVPQGLLPGRPLEEVQGFLAASARDHDAFELRRRGIGDDALRVAAGILVLSRTNVEAAAARAASAPLEVKRHFDALARVTIACELLRAGKDEVAREVLEAPGDPQPPVPPLESLRDPAAALEDETIATELRPALALAASRRTDTPVTRAEWLARARALDVLRCVLPR